MAYSRSSSLEGVGSSLRFPPSHRLGVPPSLLMVEATSSRHGIETDNSGSGIAEQGRREEAAVLSTEGVDEPDFEPEETRPDTRGKRKRSSSSSVTSLKHRKMSLPEAVYPSVLTYDDQPLSEYGLYIPQKLPRSILCSQLALCSYVISIAETFVSIQAYREHLELLDLRLPPNLSDQLGGNHSFVSQFLSAVLTNLKGVSTIDHLLLPKICLQSTQELATCLCPLEQGGEVRITALSLTLDEVKSFNMNSKTADKIVSTLQGVRVTNLHLVSTDTNSATSLQTSLQLAATKVGCTITIRCSLHGKEPFFCYEEKEDGSVEKESISPQTLLSGLNVVSASSQAAPAKSLGPKMARQRKGRAKSAYLSDCSFSKKAADELSPDDPFASNIWELEKLHRSGTDGEGITIAVIDSGINYLHPAFKEKILLVRNFVPEKLNNFDSIVDSDGHGSLCAGIAAGAPFCPRDGESSDSDSIFIPSGVAPKAKLIICKVVDAGRGEADNKAIVAALQWLKTLATTGTNIDVVSISLAASYFSKQQADLISGLTGLGVIVVCCASNEGRMRFQPISFPGRLGQVLCIGAHDDNGKPTSFSPVGREMDFLGPGKDIWGPGPGTSGPFAMDCASGTSCATPAVAGLVCLVLHRVSRMQAQHPRKYQVSGRPVLECVHNVWVMRELLREMSSSPGHHSEEIGHGTLDPYRLLDRNDDELFRLIDSIVEDE